jgi:hypothetical protein
MLDFCLHCCPPIKTPTDHEGHLPPRLRFGSLEAALSSTSEEDDCTLLDLLACPRQAAELDHLLQEEEPPSEETHQTLYQAVEQLPPQQRDVIQRYFGLEGYAPEPLNRIDKSMLTIRKASTKRNAAYTAKRKALASLHALLTGSGSKRVRWSPESTTPDPQSRLDEAYAQLQARGEPITIKGLRKLAHVNEQHAQSYLRHRRGEGVASR